MTEAKFELSEQHYRYLFENASDAMWVHDMEGNIVDVNKADEKLSGFNRKELLGKNVAEFLTGDSLKAAREVRRRLLQGQEIVEPYVQRLVRKDGTVRVVKMATSMVVIDGKPAGFQHVARDITEEKGVEERLAKIVDGSPIPSFVIDKQHKITHWNTALAAISGIRAETMVGTSDQWKAFYTGKRPTMADLTVDGAAEDEIESYYWGKYKKSSLIDGAYEAEDFFANLGERGKWLHFTASPIRDTNGDVVGAIETLQDIDDEKQLQENMRFYAQLVTKAQEEERKRLARELHDEVSSSLLLLAQGLDSMTSAGRSRQSQAVREKLESLHSQAIEALEYVRRYAQDLRPRILDDLGLLPALEWMAEDMEKHYGVKTHVEVTGDQPNLPPDVQLLVFRIAQQALTNIRRHAEASAASIKLAFEPGGLNMVVTDNGKGFEMPQRIENLASAGRLGIMGMSERAQLLGGTLEVKSAPGKGTRVVAEVPLPE